MAQNANTKRVVNFVVVLAVVGLAIYFVRLFMHSDPKPQPPQVTVNYTKNICDDAYKTEDHQHENENPEFIDVNLQEGCFSGFVAIPKAWTNWQDQMLHPGPNDWVAVWYQGWEAPAGPYTAAQINTQKINFGTVPSKYVRLEGSGVYRYYRITATSYPDK